MKAMEHEHAITELCEAFAVSRSGYYRWRDAVPCARAREDARITEVLCTAHRRSRETYGRPRLARELRAQGMRHSQRRIARLMRAARLHGVQRGCFRPQTTDSDHGREPAPNWLGQMPMPSAPNQIWVADITYVWTEEGWLYVAGVLDLCSRRIVGLASAGHLETSLPEAALRQAVLGRELPAGLLHHSDRGVQYASEHYRRMLELHGITPSMSRRANCYDNAHMESFWGTLKAELISRRRFATRHEAWLAIFDYVETFYNRVRLHSALGYQSPVDYENNLN
jgi:putative transposase